MYLINKNHNNSSDVHKLKEDSAVSCSCVCVLQFDPTLWDRRRTRRMMWCVCEIWAESISQEQFSLLEASGIKPTHELHLPLPHALHLYSVEVRQVVVLVPQGVFLQAEGGQASRSIPTRENAVRTVWRKWMRVYTQTITLTLFPCEVIQACYCYFFWSAASEHSELPAWFDPTDCSSCSLTRAKALVKNSSHQNNKLTPPWLSQTCVTWLLLHIKSLPHWVKHLKAAWTRRVHRRRSGSAENIKHPFFCQTAEGDSAESVIRAGGCFNTDDMFKCSN